MKGRDPFFVRNFHSFWLLFAAIIGCIDEFVFHDKDYSLHIGIGGGFVLAFLISILSMKGKKD